MSERDETVRLSPFRVVGPAASALHTEHQLHLQVIQLMQQRYPDYYVSEVNSKGQSSYHRQSEQSGYILIDLKVTFTVKAILRNNPRRGLVCRVEITSTGDWHIGDPFYTDGHVP